MRNPRSTILSTRSRDLFAAAEAPAIPGVDGLLASLRAQLRHKLAKAHLGELPGHLITRALRDAESIAALSPYPHLFFPALADEKVNAAKQWYQRQRQILERTALALAE